MHVTVISRHETLNTLQENWEAVHEADPEAHFFLSWPWISRWLQTGKHKWLILAAKSDADAEAYVAFFPLKYRTTNMSDGAIAKELAMAGNRVADYTGFLCLPEFADRAISAFATIIKKLDWQSLHLENICAWNKNNDRFLRYFCDKDFVRKYVKYVKQDEDLDNTVCPYVDLPDNWNSYIYNYLNSNMRRKVRRYLEAIDNPGELRITISNDDTIRRDIEILLQFWAKKWGDRKGENLDNSLNMIKTMIIIAFAQNILFMPVLWSGEKPVGALACFADKNKKSLLMYVAGRDESIQKPPPGLLLNAFCIRQAIENGYKTYDFLRGNEPYKYLFGAKERSISYIRIEPKGAHPL